MSLDIYFCIMKDFSFKSNLESHKYIYIVNAGGITVVQYFGRIIYLSNNVKFVKNMRIDLSLQCVLKVGIYVTKEIFCSV